MTDQLEKTGQQEDALFSKRTKTDEEDVEVKREAETFSSPAFLLESRGVAPALVEIAGQTPQVRTIADTGHRDNIEKLFSNNLRANGRVIEELVASVPTPQECAAVINRLEGGSDADTGKWTKLYVGLSIDKNLEIPRLESLAVSDVVDFLRPPDPSVPFERPCKPLIDAKTNQPRVCESIVMGGKVPLREFLLPSMVHSKQLPKFQRCCWLCMQRFVTIEWAKRRAKRETDSDDDNEWRVILHDYEMIINRPGGFSAKLLIPFTGRPCGVAGTVLTHDTTMYIPKTFADKQGKQPLVGWRFADEMLFRPGATKGQ